MRKHIVGPAAPPPVAATADAGGLALADIATVFVTSEAPDAPVEHAFDPTRGPGARRWRAGSPGDQVITLAFDAPQTIGRTAVEIDEPEQSRTQELTLAASTDGGQTYRELVRQEFVFSPPHTTFERETWRVELAGVTHLRLSIRPDKGDPSRRATLTSWAVWH